MKFWATETSLMAGLRTPAFTPNLPWISSSWIWVIWEYFAHVDQLSLVPAFLAPIMKACCCVEPFEGRFWFQAFLQVMKV